MKKLLKEKEMKTAIIFGKDFTITNSDYRRLVKRFDTSKFVYSNYDKYYHSDFSCPLCLRYLCSECSCRKISDSCFEVIRKIATPKKGEQHFFASSLSYKLIKGKKQIDRVHKFLVEKFK